MNEIAMPRHEGIELFVVGTEQDADITAAGTGRLVYESVSHRGIREFFVTSIKYAEIVVNTELAQYADVREILDQDILRVTRRPGLGHPWRGKQERRSRRSRRLQGQLVDTIAG